MEDADPAEVTCPGCSGRGRWREEVFPREPPVPVICDRCSGHGRVPKAPAVSGSSTPALDKVRQKAAAAGVTFGPVCKTCGEFGTVERSIIVNPDAVDRYTDSDGRLHTHSSRRKLKHPLIFKPVIQGPLGEPVA
jgi:hypothetical protein